MHTKVQDFSWTFFCLYPTPVLFFKPKTPLGVLVMASSRPHHIQVFGHKNPDTDSVIGAIALAELQNQRGMPSSPRIQGSPNPETNFVMQRFNINPPKITESVAGRQVSLVDFSDIAQAPHGFDSSTVVSLVDHHKLGDVTTTAPLEMWVWPVGCCNTILKAMYDFYGGYVPTYLAGGMLCAILSDTVLFKSPTTTDADRRAAEELAEIAGVDDIMALGMDMFRAKSDLNDSAENIFQRDYKEFDINGRKLGIGQLELMDASMIDPIKHELFKEGRRLLEEHCCHTVIFLATDIMKQGSQMLVVSRDLTVTEKAFQVTLAPYAMPRVRNVAPAYAREGENPFHINTVQQEAPWTDKLAEQWMPDMMSRKKQVLPFLMESFNSLD
jgi:manganese-dependent inorganic pyrophosphatase